MNAQRALLAEIVDYAGLFPPAALEVAAAVRHYASYREDEAAWMLGCFVAPAARLDDIVREWSSLGVRGAPLAISATLGGDALADIDRVHEFNSQHGDLARVASVEGKFTSADAIGLAASRTRDTVRLFAEIATNADPASLIDAIAEQGASAKIRTGGVTEDAFPLPTDVVRFIRRCIDASVSFKATAGLHHPLRAEYRLTYDDGAACGSMYGFLNVFLAAAFMRSGMDDETAGRFLLERQPSSFEWGNDVAWSGLRLSADDLRMTRRDLALSFGSCSFREPIDELRALQFIS